MNRRENLRALLLGGISIPLLNNCSTGTIDQQSSEQLTTEPDNKNNAGFKESPWHNLPDMTWAGPDYWGNRLQDWRVNEGKLECLYRGANRSLHCLTHQLDNSRNRFSTRLYFSIPDDAPDSEDNQIGFLLGAKTDFLDYRAAATRGKGLTAGVDTAGNLFIGKDRYNQAPVSLNHLKEGVVLEVMAEPLGMKYKLGVLVYDNNGDKLAEFMKYNVDPDQLQGNIAIWSNWKKISDEESDKTALLIDKWLLEGDKFQFNPYQTLGPICFTQYTTFNNVVKLTAQMMPVNLPSTAFLEIEENGEWKRMGESEIAYPSYTAQFRMENWEPKEPVPFRVGYVQDQKDNTSKNYYWEGTIAKEPVDKDELKTLLFSCNFDYGFPDRDIVNNASMHEADLVMFLGDQFYEPTGGYGIQKSPAGKAYLDYLRKWYQFGWSFRELFREKPTINLPDDHDVFQGNLFGAGGRPFPKNSTKGFSRDHGGFMMPPEWVNLVMDTQTSHMPDPFDPQPAEQGIHVFYTDWKYAGVSFGIIEDRKFKSGPAAILPEEAGIRDAFVTNKNYDITRDTFPEAQLIGERQVEFLKHWIEDWSNGTEFKVLVSASPFHALQTLPDGADSNGRQRRLYVPEHGEYVEGDVPVADTDSGGWPQNRRNELLEIIRKGYVIHFAGDQHLPSVTQYGLNDWQDAGTSFAVPAIANSWPRRWWPPVPENHQPLPGQPAYTGNFKDAFGNKVHVIAVANPHKTGLEPAYLYDRSVGYGVATFNKKNRQIKLECWPRYINPEAEPDKQFPGWPVTISQLDNLKPAKPHYLPTLQLPEGQMPVVRVTNEETGKLEQILRVRGNQYQPRVEKTGIYTVEFLDAEGKVSAKFSGLEAKIVNDQIEKIKL